MIAPNLLALGGWSLGELVHKVIIQFEGGLGACFRGSLTMLALANGVLATQKMHASSSGRERRELEGASWYC